MVNIVPLTNSKVELIYGRLDYIFYICQNKKNIKINTKNKNQL